jgi:hypothetical protein
MKKTSIRKPQRRKIDIAVALQWPDGEPANRKFALNEPWPTIRALIKQATEAARPVSKRSFLIHRLKARAGMSVTEGVIAAIRDADVLVFDVTPTKKNANPKIVPPNVLFEIGLALGMGKPIILIGAGKHPYQVLPSDLSGQIVETYLRASSLTSPKHRAGSGEPSIRAAIVRYTSKM